MQKIWKDWVIVSQFLRPGINARPTLWTSLGWALCKPNQTGSRSLPGFGNMAYWLKKTEYCLLFNLSYVTDLIAQVCISCHLLLVSIEVILLVLILSLNETTEIPWIGRGWPLTWGSPPCHWGTARWGCPCTCHTSSHRLADQLCSHRRLPWLQTLEIKACEWEYWVWSPSCWT